MWRKVSLQWKVAAIRICRYLYVAKPIFRFSEDDSQMRAQLQNVYTHKTTQEPLPHTTAKANNPSSIRTTKLLDFRSDIATNSIPPSDQGEPERGLRLHSFLATNDERGSGLGMEAMLCRLSRSRKHSNGFWCYGSAYACYFSSHLETRYLSRGVNNFLCCFKSNDW